MTELKEGTQAGKGGWYGGVEFTEKKGKEVVKIIRKGYYSYLILSIVNLLCL
jgi:hypothetical protein